MLMERMKQGRSRPVFLARGLSIKFAVRLKRKVFMVKFQIME